MKSVEYLELLLSQLLHSQASNSSCGTRKIFQLKVSQIKISIGMKDGVSNYRTNTMLSLCESSNFQSGVIRPSPDFVVSTTHLRIDNGDSSFLFGIIPENSPSVVWIDNLPLIIKSQKHVCLIEHHLSRQGRGGDGQRCTEHTAFPADVLVATLFPLL